MTGKEEQTRRLRYFLQALARADSRMAAVLAPLDIEDQLGIAERFWLELVRVQWQERPAPKPARGRRRKANGSQLGLNLEAKIDDPF